MGTYEPVLLEHPTLYAYNVNIQDQEIIVYNQFLGDETTTIEVEASQYDILLSNVGRQTLENTIQLKPYESLVLIKK